MKILDSAIEILQKEPNVVKVKFPATVLGDIHGQFFDLANILEKKDPQKVNYVCLGDYVDRGGYSIECLTLLLAAKVCYPNQVFLLRGNHESRQCAEHFTFREETLAKYDEELFERCLNVFDSLPLVAIISGQYLCMHGGISPHLKTMDDLNNLNRFMEVPNRGLLCDLLWADPVSNDHAMDRQFTKNRLRACSVKYGYEPVKQVLKMTNTNMLLRGHQVQ